MKPAPAHPPWRLWLLGWALCAAAPYVAHPLARWMDAWMGTSPQTASSPDPVLGNLLAVTIIAVAAPQAAGWLAASAAMCLAAERHRRTLTQLLLTRLTPADILVGKGMAVSLRTLGGLSLCFAVWVAVPPVPARADLGFIRVGQPPRELLALLWFDAITGLVALTSVGLMVSTGCRSARAAGMLAGVAVTAAALLSGEALALSAVGCIRTPSTALPPSLLTIPLGLHVGIWAICAAVAIASFVVAQALLDPVPACVRVFPGGAVWFRLSRRGAVLLLLSILAGGAAAVARAVQYRGLLHALSSRGSPQQRVGDLLSRRRYREAADLAGAELSRDWPPEVAAWLWSSKGLCHWRLREYREALIAFDEERRLSPGTDTAFRDLALMGGCLRKMGKRRQAAHEYGRAVEMVRQSLPHVTARRRDHLVGELPPLGRQMALCGDREGARAAFELAMREGDRETVLEARRDLLLLEAGLHAAPRLDIYTEGASLVVAGFLTGTRVPPTGLQPGDRILRVDGRPVHDLVGLYRILAGYQPRQRATLTVARAGKTVEVQTQLRRP